MSPTTEERLSLITPELSRAMQEKLRAADQARAEYAAQQQIICLLLERLGNSVVISDLDMTIQRRGAINVQRGDGVTTITFRKEEGPPHA